MVLLLIINLAHYLEFCSSMYSTCVQWAVHSGIIISLSIEWQLRVFTTRQAGAPGGSTVTSVGYRLQTFTILNTWFSNLAFPCKSSWWSNQLYVHIGLGATYVTTHHLTQHPQRSEKHICTAVPRVTKLCQSISVKAWNTYITNMHLSLQD